MADQEFELTTKLRIRAAAANDAKALEQYCFTAGPQQKLMRNYWMILRGPRRERSIESSLKQADMRSGTFDLNATPSTLKLVKSASWRYPRPSASSRLQIN